MEDRIKLLESRLNLIAISLGKTINGLSLSSDEKRDLVYLCELSENDYVRSLELREAFHKHIELQFQLTNLEIEYPELKNKGK